MFDRFITFLGENELIAPSEKVLLAVSGGVDSMVMAELFLKSGLSFGVAHVNYGLRKEADGDEVLVKDWAVRNSIPVYVRRMDSQMLEEKQSVQMVARAYRYEFFNELLGEGYDKVATAHHLDDSLETVLLNLVKGTGLKGLTGIPVKNDRIVRPLMFTSRSEIAEFARRENIRWREDHTNARNDYQRNFIRNEIVRRLTEINPNLIGTFASTLSRLRGSFDLLEERVDEVWKKHSHSQGDSLVLSVEWFKGSSRWAVLDLLLKRFGFNYSVVCQVGESIERGISGKEFFSSTHEVNLDRNILLIRSVTRREAEPVQIDGPGSYIVGRQELMFTTFSADYSQLLFDPSAGYVDLSQVSFPLMVRPWRQGDTFQPLGMKGKKKISDFMIDSKIPLTLKKEVLVVEHRGTIIWVVGMRIDDRFRLTPNTRSILKMEIVSHV